MLPDLISELPRNYNALVGVLSFRWDPAKNSANRRKHHSEEEDRFLLLGLSSQLRTLVVCHCYKEATDVIRIISARKADRAEREQYMRRSRS